MKVRKGTISHRGLKFDVKILEVRKNFGRTDYLVTPVRGSGELWTRKIGVRTGDNENQHG